MRRSPELSRRLLIGYATALTAVVLFVWFAEELLHGNSSRFDENVRNFIHFYASPALTSTMQTISNLGSVAFLVFSGAIISIGLLWAKSRRGLALFLLTMAGASALNFLLKLAFRRARPSSFFGTALPDSFSFPSGHALLSLCFYSIVAYWISTRCGNVFIQAAVWTGALLLIGAIGLSRIYLGVHYPSDVIAGYAVGIFWVILVVIIDQQSKPTSQPNVSSSSDD
jgi:undecaprenyl-diphosphatase